VTAGVAADRDIALQGRYAGPVTRLGAFMIDVAAATLLFVVGAGVLEFLLSEILSLDFHLADVPFVSVAAGTVWAFVYFSVPLAASGRTLGMAVWGLRLVRSNGGDVDGRHAALRVAAMPLSFLLFGLGLLLILVHPAQRALHDLIADTAVVYAWDARAARLRFLARGG
jgi:uncharacterized RDD family membrane protein YckC